MNLDEYFSKYVDAELSAAEDAEMRAFLTEDDAARAEFEQAALISVAMMREAECIDTPDDLFASTNELVLSKIAENTRKIPVSTLQRQRQGAFALAIALCIIILGDSVRLGDRDSLFRAALSQGLASAAVLQDPVDQEILLTRGGAKRHANDQKIPSVRADQASDYASTAQVAIQNEIASAAVLAADSHQPSAQSFGMQSALPASSYADQTADQDAFAKALASAAGLRNRLNVMSIPDLTIATTPVVHTTSSVADFQAPATTSQNGGENVQLNTFVGSIVKSSATAASMQHYSQSIGYPVSDGVNMGLEVGTFSLMATVPEQFGTSAISASDVKHKGSLSKVENASLVSSGSSNGPNYGDQSGGIVSAHSVVWGAAFIERSVISSSALSVKARVAVGSSDGGALVYARAITALNVYGPISLTLGTEGRMFFYDDKNTNNTDQTLQTMMSVMYGVQIKF